MQHHKKARQPSKQIARKIGVSGAECGCAVDERIDIQYDDDLPPTIGSENYGENIRKNLVS